MKTFSLFNTLFCLVFLFISQPSEAQDNPVGPGITGTGTYHGLTHPLRDLPVLSAEEFRLMEAEERVRNKKLAKRSYPYAKVALPKGPDPVWQSDMGAVKAGRGIIMNFNGQNSPYFPPDANGAAGPLYYMQSINTVYAIYHKETGAIAAGPTNLNQLFSGVTGSNCNDGDPLILYDETADRWLAVEFSICSSNDRMLVAVSQTNDPTGAWHKYSFDVADMPDYPKFGIWRDGYYMGTNNSTGNDIYVFERDQMLIGGTAQMVGFNNPWRPTTIDGFMCVPPLDNDGPLAPEGAPGLFITLNDDAIGGGADQLWIYELVVDWDDISNATFTRVQQLNVPPFDSNFGSSWDNIRQPGTSQRLDAIPMVIMNRPQYRNFGAYETIVCCHTVDLDATNHAGIRWYELRRNGGDWSVRQTGTYGPDEHSRWMGSISLNGSNEIGLAYSISSTTEYPGLRFTGQSAAAYAAASGELDITETNIQTGSNSQTGANRWGDYADLCVDPDNDHTFWFSSQYGGSRMTRIASFEFAPQAIAANFTASTMAPCEGSAVAFTDLSTGLVTAWSWTFEGGEPSASNLQNPVVTYPVTGTYDVTLIISDGLNSDTLLMEDYIQAVNIPDQPVMPTGDQDVCKGATGLAYVTGPVADAMSYLWSLSPAVAGTIIGTDTMSVLSVSDSFTGTLWVKVRASNECGSSPVSDSLSIIVHNGPEVYSMDPDGGYCEGDPGFEVILPGSQANVTYALFLDGLPTGTILPGTGTALSFGYQAATGDYTIEATDEDCSRWMSGTTSVYLIPGPEIATPPTGPDQVCNTETDTEYSTEGAVNAISYQWQLTPAEAGIISGNGKVAGIAWNPAFSGTAAISVQGVDECGTGPMSEPISVNVIDAPHPVISGQVQVCHVSSNSVYFYTTPKNPDNSYFWTVTGGNLVTLQGANQAIVTWSSFGAGSITVTESSPSGCITVSDPLEVTIEDCTGLPEKETANLSLFPNPTDDELTIRAETEKPGTFQLLVNNSNGQPVLQKEIRSLHQRLDVTISTATLPSGVYSVKVISAEGKVYEGKVVKK